MIIIAGSKKPFRFTPKQSIIRKASLADYESEIDATYRAVAESAEKGVAGPTEWSPDSVHDFVKQVVFKIMEQELADDDDIFVHGGDRYIHSPSHQMTFKLMFATF